jgi:hypothetical protein
MFELAFRAILAPSRSQEKTARLFLDILLISKRIEPLLLSAQVRHALQVSLSRLFGVVELLVAVVAVVLLCRHEARLFSILLNSPPPRLQIFSSISLAPNIDWPVFLPNTTEDALHEVSPFHLPFRIKAIPMFDVGPQMAPTLILRPRT